MEVGDVLALPITEASQVGEARRAAARWIQRLAPSEEEAGRVALVVTELAGNLSKHARGDGELLVRALPAGGVDVVALDRAPGMASVAEAMRDGYSTAGTPGTGLGAVVRAADLFDVHSLPGVGTAILARLWTRAGRAAAAEREVETGIVSVPKLGESVCGDGCAIDALPGRTSVLVVDGLGHGMGAAEASREAVRAFSRGRGLAPGPRVEAMHEALRGTRGAALAVADLDLQARELIFAGVGNIVGVVLSPEGTRSMISHNGTAGVEVRKVQEFRYPWPDGALLVMNSDGLTSRWALDGYPGMLARHPALVAGVLYRDFSRGRDDVTVAVVRAASR